MFRRCCPWLALLIVTGVCSCRRPPGSEPVNIVLISIDSLRADHVHSYGYARETTPHLDRLAGEGALFENVVAESSWTLPTHMTMFTGLPSHAHGVEYSSGPRLDPDAQTLAKRLRDEGYRTWGLFSGPFLHPVYGFGEGFDHYENVMGTIAYDEEGFDLTDESPELDSTIKAVNRMAHRAVTSPAVTRKALDFLGSNPRRPFFLFLHYFDVHYDYIPPETCWRVFDPDYDGDLSVSDYERNGDIHPHMKRRDLEHVIALYDGEILFTDEHIGYLIDALDRNGLSESTLVVVTSDHGQEFFEHGNKGHYRNLYDETIMVPLIFRLPGRIPAGLRLGGQVRHLDIMPTLLSFAGVAETDGIPGTNLTPILQGQSGPVAREAVSRLLREGLWVSWRTRDFKYILHREGTKVREYLFDLKMDPRERAPVFRREQEETGEFATLVDRIHAGLPEEVFAIGSGTKEAVELPEGLLERLRSLGYIQ